MHNNVQMASWFPDGESLCVMGQEAGHGMRLYHVDPVTGRFEAFSDEGISSLDLLVSPDGSSAVARGPDLTLMRFPTSGGSPTPVKGVGANDRPIRWSADGAAIFVFTRGDLPSKVFRVDLASGERTLWAELAPSDPTGVEGLTGIRMTDDEKSYAYAYSQRLNDLFVVDGLF